MGFGREALEDFSHLLEVMGPPPSFILQSKSCFLKSLGELGLVDSGISLASEEPAAGVDRSCPLLCYVSGVMVSFPAPPSMLSAFWFHLPTIRPFLPPSVNFTASWFLSNLP